MINVKDNNTMMYTDLAVEIQEECSGRQGEIPGVVLEQYKEDDKCIRVTKIQIKTADGAKSMGRPIGNYMTLESADKGHSTTKLPDTKLLASYINKLLPSSAHSFLIVGLGNANMTADALGPLTIEKMAQSGMESSEIIQGIVQQTSPDCIITIDALAARSAFRLGTTVQLTDTGIRPGSGVGNARKGITKENMKIPVIAIGIPTVVSAAAIVSDAMDSLKQIGYNETVLGSIAMLDQEEYYQLISEVFAPELGNLFVMPKNLDEELDTMSSLLAASLSQVICKR